MTYNLVISICYIYFYSTQKQFKIQFRKECGLDSHHPHHPIFAAFVAHCMRAGTFIRKLSEVNGPRSLREMTIGRYRHDCTWHATRDAAIPTNRSRDTKCAFND